MSWYDIDKIDNKTYVLSENRHWHEFNTYYLIGEKYNLVIDCGIGLHSIKNVLKDIDDKKMRLVLTHMHWDHIGNIKEFDNIYLSQKGNYYLKNGIKMPIERVRKLLVRNLKEEDIPDDFDIENYYIETSDKGNIVKDGYEFDLGNRIIEVIDTPGHTDHHISLYDHKNKYFFSGDLLYKGPLFLNADYIDLDKYFTSLHKIIHNYDQVEKILISHGKPELEIKYLKDIYKFILKLKEKGEYKKGNKVKTWRDYKIYL